MDIHTSDGIGALARAITLSMGLLAFPHLSAQTDPPEQAIDLKALEQDVEDFRGRLARVRGAVDRAGFDPEAMVDRLDFEAGQILDYVQKSIAFQPYEGALRGVAGTLQSGAGNSLDQSILLASMLKSAGYDARVVNGTLSDEDAGKLLRQTAQGAPNESLDYLRDSLAKAFPNAPAFKEDKDPRSTMAYQVAVEQERSLLQALGAAGIGLEPRDVTGQWSAVTKAYFWVQHRDGPGSDWQDAHPAFGSSVSPSGITPEAYFADSIPSRYHHTFSISAWMEQLMAGEITKHRLMAPWTGPVANLNGMSISYRNAPSGLTLETASELDQAVAGTQFLMPMLNGAQAPGAQAFDLKGRPIDPMALGSPAAGLFKTLGDKMVDATEGVQANQDGQPVMALHSMWLEFTFTTPSGESQTHRRYLLAPRDDYSGDEQDLVWPLMTNHVYMLSAGGQPADLLADRYLETEIQGLDWLEFMFRKVSDPETGIPLPTDSPEEIGPLFLYWLTERHPGLDPDVVAYRSRPGLLGLRSGFRDAKTGFVGVDIVWNAIEHVRVNGAGLEQVPRSALSRGVWETALESVPAQSIRLEPVGRGATTQVFKLAAAQGLESQVIKPEDGAIDDALGLDAAAKRFLEDDLLRGYVAVLPSEVPIGAPLAGWWRVDPDSGQTLGMTGDGYGQEMTEYLVSNILMAMRMVKAVQSLKRCELEGTMQQKLCCVLEAHVTNSMGASLAGVSGGVTGGIQGVFMFGVANMVAEAIPGSDGLTPQADMGCDQLPPSDW